MEKILVYEPDLSGNEKKYVNDCLDTTWISSRGKYGTLFENKFAEYIGVKYATTVANGTLALHLALLALGIGAGDEVIIPTFTYIAPANAITYTGAKPIFVDSKEDTWQMDSKDIARKITSRTKAILAVHLYGHPCEMDKIVEIAKKNNLFLVEDCAEAIGSVYQGTKTGAFGDISCFSFFGNKTITCGEGGMVLTNDKTLYERAVHFKGQGLARHREYWHDVVGYNYRMTNICAAIGLAQLERIDILLKKKKYIAKYYENNLKEMPIEFHAEKGDVVHTYWMCSIKLESSEVRDELREYLQERKIETRPTFYPIHTMPMYDEKYQRHPVAENIGWTGINLPSGPNLTVEQLEYICLCIKNYFGKKNG